MIEYHIIGTGSDGNAVIINDCILIDCGVPYNMISEHVKDLKLVLLTHIHSDHFKRSTVSKIAKERPTVRFGCCQWMVTPLVDAGVKPKNIDIYVFENTYRYGDAFSVSAFELWHDVPNCGYKLLTDKGRAVYATDTRSLDGIDAKDYDLYMVEANYDDAEMEERIRAKTEAGQYAYEVRAKENHLSKAKCDAWVYSQMGVNSRYIYLHQHKKMSL